MKYYEIINEFFNPIRIKDIEQTISEYNPMALNKIKNNIIIFRGMKVDNIPSFETQPLQNRKSPFSSNNFYNLLMSNLPAWQDYPKRNNSFICSTDKRKASEYGNDLFVVIPKGNPTIGICENEDLWLSFNYMCDEYGIKDADDFNKNLKYVFDIMKNLNITDKMPQSNYPELINILKNLSPEDYEKLEDELPYRKLKMFLKNDTILDSIVDMLDPVKNHFKKMTYDNYNLSTIISNREIWFSAPALFISYKYYRQQFLKLGI